MNPCSSTEPRPLRASCVMVLLALCLWADSARADGKVFPSIAFPAEVKIPDQSALLVWSNGVERLVIETRFIGEGTNFAWVVPLPSVPVIEPATAGLFPTLRYFFAPELRHTLTPWWAIALTIGSLLWLRVRVRAGSRETPADMAACVIAAAGLTGLLRPALGEGVWLFGALFFLTMVLAVWLIRRGTAPVYIILVVVFLMSLLAGLFLPALGKAKGGAGQTVDDGVQLLDRKLVGVFETVTLAASNSAALMDWLKENQYAVSPDCEPVIRDYLRDGWVFVAAKVQSDIGSRTPVAPHPMSFTFQTPTPVYPLRLTGVGNERLEVELFVAGPDRARANGFKVTESHRVDRRTDDGAWFFNDLGRMGHPQLLAWAGETPTLTRLHGTLDAAAMTRDAEMEWEQFRPARTRVYSKTGALTLAANWTVPVFVTFILAWALIHSRRRLPGRRGAGTVLFAAVGCALLGGAVYAATTKVEVRIDKMPRLISRVALREIPFLADCYPSTNEVTGLAHVRAAIARFLASPSARTTSNLLLGGPIREEDSPGNFTLRQTDAGIEFIAYDHTGQGTVVHVIPTNSPAR